jgi:hypothetical protein
MLSLTTAKTLRDAGLRWEPAQLDFFAIPMPGFEDQVFVLSNMTVMAEAIRSRLELTFHGTVEWALDHLWVGEAVWMPREEQLRELLEERLLGEPQPALTLETSRYGYRCTIFFRQETLSFEAFEASEAYAAGLLHTLRSSPRANLADHG